MVYLWKIDDEFPENLIGKYDREKSPDRFIFKKSELLQSDLGTPIINFDANVDDLKKFDDLANSSMIPIISERLAKLILEFAPDDIQLIDVVMEAANGSLEGYKMLNVVNKVFGIDKARSEFTFIPGTDQIMSFQSLKYKDDCLLDHHLARDAEYSSNLIVSEELAQKILDMNPVGLALYKP